MHTGIISFADRIVHNIKTNDMKDIILDQLYSLYGIKIIQKQYHRLDEVNIKHVKNDNHMCNMRSNGNPYYMFFTTNNEIPIIYFVDKKVHPGYQKPRILLVRGMFAEALYQNTVIDGEMVKCNNGKWIFLLNDIIAYEGKHLLRMHLTDRLKILYHLLDTQYTPDKVVDVCDYKIKTYYTVCKESVESLISLSKKLNYTCRGIYLWSSDMRYKHKLFNFNEENIINVVRKVKDETEFQTIEEPNRNESDTAKPVTQVMPVTQAMPVTQTTMTTNKDNSEMMLWISQTDHPDVYNLYASDSTVSAKYGIALIPNLITSKMLRIAFKNKNAATMIKTRCSFNTKFNKWCPEEIK
jgi:hypothetical protein